MSFGEQVQVQESQQRKATRFDQYQKELEEAPFYCPGCGLRYNYQRECVGRGEAPHKPIEVVSTDELQGDEHTAAPNTDK